MLLSLGHQAGQQGPLAAQQAHYKDSVGSLVRYWQASSKFD